jgi:hypothetical protein
MLPLPPHSAAPPLPPRPSHLLAPHRPQATLTCGGRQLAARRDAVGQEPLKEDGVQLGAGGVDGGGVGRGAAADDAHLGLGVGWG